MDPLQTTPIALSRPELDVDDDLAWMAPEGKVGPVVNVIHEAGRSAPPFPVHQWQKGAASIPISGTPVFLQAATPLVAADSTPAWMENAIGGLIRSINSMNNPKPAAQSKQLPRDLAAKVYSPFLGER